MPCRCDFPDESGRKSDQWPCPRTGSNRYGGRGSDPVYTGLRYHLNLARVAAGRVIPAMGDRLARQGVRAEALPDPALPAGAGFVALEPLLAGICGSDLGLLTGRASPYLAPLTSFPAVLGHEVVARVVDTDAPLPRGTRVVVDPSLGCQARGLPACPACATGREDACAARADGGIGAGLLLGFNQTLPGGWATSMWAPRTQLHPVPDSIPSARAVLAEPLAIAAAGLQSTHLAQARRVLVIGAGSLGLLALYYIAAHHSVELIVAARYPHQRDWAVRLGAGAVKFLDAQGVRDGLAGRALGRGPLGAPPFYPEGADIVVDSVGSRSSFATALTLCRPDGEVLVLGALSAAADLSPIWSRRLTVRGSFGYRVGGTTVFPAVLDLICHAPELDGVVTATFPLERYADAVAAALDRRAGSIKVAFAAHGDPER